jgi:uncharacterized protein DUF4838
MTRPTQNTNAKGLNRRQFIGASAGLLGSSFASALLAQDAVSGSPFFKTRGIILRTDDDLVTWGDHWPRLAAESGLTTIATHMFPGPVAEYLASEKGAKFREDCEKYGLDVEHELHSMEALLPRDLYDKAPHMFRMDEQGNRIREYNLCVHSKEAIEIVCQNAVKYAALFAPTTSRHFFWIDDGRPMCRCSKCRELSDSDQALLLENAMIKALRAEDPKASLAHLAYLNTISPPETIRPDPGIFLEFAPIRRRFDQPLKNGSARANEKAMSHGETLEKLDENLAVFDKGTAQVLDYWIDVSLFSRWKRPAVKLPWNRDVFRSDLEVYASRGIRNITSFAAFVDADYVRRFGEPAFVREYGQDLQEFVPS